MIGNGCSAFSMDALWAMCYAVGAVRLDRSGGDHALLDAWGSGVWGQTTSVLFSPHLPHPNAVTGRSHRTKAPPKTGRIRSKIRVKYVSKIAASIVLKTACAVSIVCLLSLHDFVWNSW